MIEINCQETKDLFNRVIKSIVTKGHHLRGIFPYEPTREGSIAIIILTANWIDDESGIAVGACFFFNEPFIEEGIRQVMSALEEPGRALN